ncbi:hypothetical protein SNEBB_004207 [Seison nebaliae]|nr:hypothetical protein SNEBB_004207 [Seison nebaliae]
MSESIILQIGQCGNQIGLNFWELALKENEETLREGKNYMKSFFHETSSGKYEARAILLDLEEGVISKILQRTKISHIFSEQQLFTSTNGAGNNWAVGREALMEEKSHRQIEKCLRRTIEKCDYLRTFFTIHSMSGGTGSGIGSNILHILHDNYPKKYLLPFCVYSTETDENVITAPYNSILATTELLEYGDCVFPFDNESLFRLTQTNETNRYKKDDVFATINRLIANTILDITAHSRYHGEMNVDLNEISMNLVPFKSMNYISTYQAQQTTNIHRLFDDCFHRPLINIHQYLNKKSCLLSSGVLLRTNRSANSLSMLRETMMKMKGKFPFANWNEDCWKIGICHQSSIYHNSDTSLLLLNNTSLISNYMNSIYERFHNLFKRRAHLHHYLNVDGFDLNHFHHANEIVINMINNYQSLSHTMNDSLNVDSSQRICY